MGLDWRFCIVGEGDGDVWDRFGLACTLDYKTHERQHKMIENKQIFLLHIQSLF